MKSTQQGFTIIELVVVIVILGILAAVAIPRFAAYTTDSRIATLNGLAGAIRSAVSVVQSRYVATGNTAATTVTMADGVTTVTVSSGAGGGIPVVAAGGIDNAVNVSGTFAYAGGVFDFPTAVTNCFVTYAATGTATLTTTGC
jgi:MSHA pilin protein MshA